MDRLAVFDVDYTLTKHETQIELVKYLIRQDITYLRYLPNSVMAALLYLAGFHDEKASKEQNLKFLRGVPEAKLTELAGRFFEDAVEPILFADGMETLRRHHGEGMRIILNSASPEFYIREFERYPYIEKAMGSRFEIKEGVFTGRMVGPNNKGEEKIIRLMEYLGGAEIDWEQSVMYSDSLSDTPLMKRMGKAYLINHKETPQFPVLRWK